MMSLRKRIEQGIENTTPGIVVHAYHKGNLAVKEQVGTTYKFYDLASLTKIIFTATQIIKMFEDHKIDLDLEVRAYLPWYPNAKVKVSQLLNHTSGHKAWNPYYKEIIRTPHREKLGFTQLMQPYLAKENISDPVESVYSDINFLLLGCLLEKVCDRSLLDIWNHLNSEMGLSDTRFHPSNLPAENRELYAPTEVCLWRKKVIQGEVHDDNTWSINGVSTHAGLFSTIEDVSHWGLMLRQKYLSGAGGTRYFASKSTPIGDWGLGFMKPSRPKSSCGHFFSPEAFGHTGFTGTSIWFDPASDLLVVILSNRTFPDRNNFRFRDLRGEIHDWIYEKLVGF